MSEVENTQENIEAPDELQVLKERADKMGMSYHPNIGLETLRNKINNKLQGNSESQDLDGKVDATETVPIETVPVDLTEPEIEKLTEKQIANKTENILLDAQQRRLQKVQSATRLVRVRLSCMNPNKKAWEGEIITVSNSIVGSLKKYIPFNNEEGWHIPYMMYLHLKDRQCQIFVQKRNHRGQKVMQPKLIKEFAIELMPDLTEQELKDLGQRQAVAGSLD